MSDDLTTGDFVMMLVRHRLWTRRHGDEVRVQEIPGRIVGFDSTGKAMVSYYGRPSPVAPPGSQFTVYSEPVPVSDLKPRAPLEHDPWELWTDAERRERQMGDATTRDDL